MHYIIYNSMTLLNRRLPPKFVNKLKKTLNVQGNVHYTYENVPQQPDNVSCGLFTIAYAINTAFNISPFQFDYNALVIFILICLPLPFYDDLFSN
jgi:Ulp1 family protease